MLFQFLGWVRKVKIERYLHRNVIYLDLFIGSLAGQYKDLGHLVCIFQFPAVPQGAMHIVALNQVNPTQWMNLRYTCM